VVLLFFVNFLHQLIQVGLYQAKMDATMLKKPFCRPPCISREQSHSPKDVAYSIHNHNHLMIHNHVISNSWQKIVWKKMMEVSLTLGAVYLHFGLSKISSTSNRIINSPTSHL